MTHNESNLCFDMIAPIRIFRYAVFVPAAIIASVVGGWIGHLVGSFFGFGIFGGELYLAWFLSGLISSVAFLFVGMNVAPRASEVVKRILLVLWILLGLMASAGPFLAGNELLPSIAGVTMVICAIANLKTPADTFDIWE
jgi:hypothetical protein